MLRVLKVFGIDRGGWSIVKILNLVTVLILLGLIAPSLISRPSYAMNMFSLPIPIIFMMVRHVMSKHIDLVVSIIRTLTKNLDVAEKGKVRKLDKVAAISITFGSIIRLTTGMVNTFVFKSKYAIAVFIGGNVHNYMSDEMIEVFFFLTIAYQLIAILAIANFYTLVQLMLIKHAVALRHLFELDTQVSVKYLRYCQVMYRQHSDCKRSINKLLGFIPFAFLAMTFIFIMVILSFYVINDAKLSLSFKLLVIAPASITFVMTFMGTIRTADDATIAFVAARVAAGRVVTENRVPERVRREMDKFYELILTDGIVEATAWGFFDINRGLVLNFVNAVIPFAVMIITASTVV